MKDIVEEKGAGKFAKGQSSRDLRVSEAKLSNHSMEV